MFPGGLNLSLQIAFVSIGGTGVCDYYVIRIEKEKGFSHCGLGAIISYCKQFLASFPVKI